METWKLIMWIRRIFPPKKKEITPEIQKDLDMIEHYIDNNTESFEKSFNEIFIKKVDPKD